MLLLCIYDILNFGDKNTQKERIITMIFQELTHKGGAVMIDYTTTWGYGYEFILDAARLIIANDFKENLQHITTAAAPGGEQTVCTDAVKAAGGDLRLCPETSKENGLVTIAGISSIMRVPVQFIFFNQTNLVRLICPVEKYIEEHGDHIFDNFMNSIEIKASCAAAERSAEARIRAEYDGKQGI